MDNVKPWQIILMVLAVAVFGFSIWRFGGFGSSIPKHESILLVDVMTGQLYDAHKGDAKGILLPARAPGTGERTLFPVEQDESGAWRLRDRYVSTFKQMQLKSEVVSADMTVRVKSDEPEYYEPILPGNG